MSLWRKVKNWHERYGLGERARARAPSITECLPHHRVLYFPPLPTSRTETLRANEHRLQTATMADEYISAIMHMTDGALAAAFTLATAAVGVVTCIRGRRHSDPARVGTSWLKLTFLLSFL